MASRTIMSIERLPDRSKNTGAERILLIPEDTKDAMMKLRRRLEDQMATRHLGGWVGDLDSIEYTLTPQKTSVMGKVVMTRPDDI